MKLIFLILLVSCGNDRSKFDSECLNRDQKRLVCMAEYLGQWSLPNDQQKALAQNFCDLRYPVNKCYQLNE
jgi:hypothetical protein